MLRIKVTSVSGRLEKGIHFEAKWERALFGGDDICQRIMDLTIHLICIEGLWKIGKFPIWFQIRTTPDLANLFDSIQKDSGVHANGDHVMSMDLRSALQ